MKLAPVGDKIRHTGLHKKNSMQYYLSAILIWGCGLLAAIITYLSKAKNCGYGKCLGFLNIFGGGVLLAAAGVAVTGTLRQRVRSNCNINTIKEIKLGWSVVSAASGVHGDCTECSGVVRTAILQSEFNTTLELKPTSARA